MSSMHEPMLGKSSLTSMPDWPCFANFQGEASKLPVLVRSSLGFSNGNGLPFRWRAAAWDRTDRRATGRRACTGRSRASHAACDGACGPHRDSLRGRAPPAGSVPSVS